MMTGSRGRLCAAVNCSNRQKNGMSCFRFPRDKERCHQWIVNCNRHDLLAKWNKCPLEHYNRSYTLCTDHFEEHCFMNRHRNSLIHSAIPTLFCASSKSQKVSKSTARLQYPPPHSRRISETSLDNDLQQSSENLEMPYTSESMSRDESALSPEVVVVKDEPADYFICCCAGCHASSLTHRLFSFPTDPRQAHVWLEYANRQELLPFLTDMGAVPSNFLLCEDHFSLDSFVGSTDTKQLRTSAVPSISASSPTTEEATSSPTTDSKAADKWNKDSRSAQSDEENCSKDDQCKASTDDGDGSDLNRHSTPPPGNSVAEDAASPLSVRKDLFNDVTRKKFANRRRVMKCISEKITAPIASKTNVNLTFLPEVQFFKNLHLSPSGSSSSDPKNPVKNVIFLKNPSKILGPFNSMPSNKTANSPPSQSPSPPSSPKNLPAIINPNAIKIQRSPSPSTENEDNEDTSDASESARYDHLPVKTDVTPDDSSPKETPDTKKPVKEVTNTYKARLRPPITRSRTVVRNWWSGFNSQKRVLKTYGDVGRKRGRPRNHNGCAYKPCTRKICADNPPHKVPDDYDTRRVWLQNVGDPHLLQEHEEQAGVGDAPRELYLCSAHFQMSCFLRLTSTKWRKLSPSAVPTLFSGGQGPMYPCKRKSVNTGPWSRCGHRDCYKAEDRMIELEQREYKDRKRKWLESQADGTNTTLDTNTLPYKRPNITGPFAEDPDACRLPICRGHRYLPRQAEPITVTPDLKPPFLYVLGVGEQADASRVSRDPKKDQKVTQAQLDRLEELQKELDRLKNESNILSKHIHTKKSMRYRAIINSRKLRDRPSVWSLEHALSYCEQQLSAPSFGFIKTQLTRYNKPHWNVNFIEIPMVLLRCNVDVATVLRSMFTLPTWSTLSKYRMRIRANPNLISNTEIVRHVVQVMKYDHRFYRNMGKKKFKPRKLSGENVDDDDDDDDDSIRYSVSEVLCRYAKRNELPMESVPEIYCLKPKNVAILDALNVPAITQKQTKSEI